MRRIIFVLSFSAISLACLSSAAAADDSVGWVVECGFSHRLSDDPIVFPGSPGASHRHDFFGNVTANAASTYSSLLSGDTTCELSADTAGYWAPTLYVNGEPKVPFNVDFYYRNTTVPNSAVEPFPPGLRIVAGDAKATGEQDTSVIDWNCDNEGSDSGPRPRDCGDDFVEAHVKFPDCWDGVSIDSPDHKSHMAYHVDDDDGDNVCPPSHPVPVPKLILRFHYPVHDGTKIMLSSGAHFTLHADFFNAWDQGSLEILVDQCINADVDCGKPNDEDPSPLPPPSSDPDPDPDPDPNPDPLEEFVGNPGFESDTLGWTTSRGIDVRRVDGGHESAHAARLANSGSRLARCSLRDRPNWVSTTSAGAYTAGLWVRSDERGRTLRLRLRELADREVVSREVSAVSMGLEWSYVDLTLEPERPGESALALDATTARLPAGVCFYADDASISLTPAG